MARSAIVSASPPTPTVDTATCSASARARISTPSDAARRYPAVDVPSPTYITCSSRSSRRSELTVATASRSTAVMSEAPAGSIDSSHSCAARALCTLGG